MEQHIWDTQAIFDVYCPGVGIVRQHIVDILQAQVLYLLVGGKIYGSLFRELLADLLGTALGIELDTCHRERIRRNGDVSDPYERVV